MHELHKNGITDIDTSHGDILAALHNHKSLTMGEITSAIGKDKSTVTALVNKLVRLGYVEKAKSDTDSRVSNVSLTKKCRKLAPVFEGLSRRLITTIYKDFPESEKKMIMKLLTRVNDNL